jgi:DNA polymerase-3 subunit gamma/tau
MVQEDDVPQGLLFAGPRGCGKTSAARILATSLDAGEVVEVDAASHGLVADVREVIETLRYSTGGKYRVVIYDEAHSMSKEAFNALLKTLEEPPAQTVFILVTTEPEKIPPTVKSRLMEFTFRKVSAALTLDRLVHVSDLEQIDVEPELLTYLAERADGAVRDALVMLDQCARAEITTREEFLKLSGEEDVAPDLILALMTGDHSHIFDVTDELAQRVPDPHRLGALLTRTLKDVLVMKAGGTVDASEEGLAKRKEIASHLEPERVVGAMKMLWDLRTRVRQSTDPRGNLDIVLVLVSEIFNTGRKVPVKPTYAPGPKLEVPVVEKSDSAPVPQEARRLTLEEL